jgi:hypothetical protein
MGAMDPVTICNMALMAFGAQRITTIDEDQADSDESALCSVYFDPSVRACLEERAWLFATGFINLGARQDSPYKDSGGEHPLVAQFAYDPGVIVKPLVCDDGSGDFSILWERNGQYILSEDTDTLLLKCVQYIKDPTKWTPNFAFTVAYHLASVICGPITHSAAIEERMYKKYEVQLKKAAALDGLQGATIQQVTMKTELSARRR